ncbi:DUF86 domain-containing protein [bacterium]|nr:DUF86 domain-containing protein [bacterium]
MKRDELVYLKHILDAISEIEEYIENVNHEKFLATRIIQNAVIRQFEIIGEATRRLSEELRQKYKVLPWKEMAGMRDKLIHDYFGVDLEAVWDTATKDIRVLKDEIKNILEKEG